MPIDDRLFLDPLSPTVDGFPETRANAKGQGTHRRVAFIGAVPRAGTTTAECAWALAEMEIHPRTSVAVVDLSDRPGYAELLLRGYTDGGGARISVHRPEAGENPDALLRRIAADMIVCDLGCPQPWWQRKGFEDEPDWHEKLRWIGGAGFEAVAVSWRDASALRELQTLLGILPQVGVHEPRVLLTGPDLPANALRDIEAILGATPRGDFPWHWEEAGWAFDSRRLSLRLRGLPGDPGASDGTKASTRPPTILISIIVTLVLVGLALEFSTAPMHFTLFAVHFLRGLHRTL